MVTLHYHGTPITPREVLLSLAGRHFCVSFAEPRDVAIAHQIGQSVMLDNGAFSLWRAGRRTDWPGYYGWADRWLDHPTTWAIIPDVIEGGEAANDALIADWPHGDRGAPVWHLHEPVERLLRLADDWPRICFGSSAEYAEIGTPRWERRMDEAFNALAPRHRRLPWLHMLRGISLAGERWPFASLDSTNIARNHAGNNTRGAAAKDARAMAERIDAVQCPATWEPRAVQMELVG